jgi:hypothetical protein
MNRPVRRRPIPTLQTCRGPRDAAKDWIMEFEQAFPLRFWINLGRREDRRNETEARLEEAGVTAERFAAVDGRCKKPEARDKRPGGAKAAGVRPEPAGVKEACGKMPQPRWKLRPRFEATSRRGGMRWR